MKKHLPLLLALLLLALPVWAAQAEVSLPGALTAISDQAFEGNAAFSGVIELPGGVSAVGNQAFKNTDIFGLKLPAAVRHIGAGILESSGTTYAIVGNASPVLAAGALNDVDVIVSRTGGSVEQWARSNGVSFYDMTMLCYSDGFAYLYEWDGSVTLAFPMIEHTGAVTIPKAVNGYPVTHVSENAFTNLTGVTAISLPDTVEWLPVYQTNWPDAEISYYPANPSNPVLPPEASSSPHRVFRLQMDPERITLNAGQTVKPEMIDPPTASWRRNCVWVSSDESVASVDENGVVTAVGAGTASITATVRVASLDEVATAGEAIPELVYYGVTIVDVEQGDLAVTVNDYALSLTVGQGYYPSYDISSPSRISYPTVSFSYEDSVGAAQGDAAAVVSYEKIGNGALFITACNPGTAKITVIAEHEGETASGVIEVKVAEPKLAVNFASLMTYPGYQYDLRVTDELPEGAAVSWESANDWLITVDETGHAVVVGSFGETTITCTLTEADGRTTEAVIPVSVKSGFSWWYGGDRVLSAGWEYHEGFEDLMPGYECDLWPHDGVGIDFSAESDNEDVLSFLNYRGGIVARAGIPGEAQVTYTATLDYPETEDAVAPESAHTVTVPVVVVMDFLEACLSADEIYMQAGEVFNVGAWWRCNTDISRQWLYSTDESVFTVDAFGTLTAQGRGTAELVYVVEAYGITAETRATVTVDGWEILMEPEELHLQVGESASILARMTMPEGEDEDAETYHYDSHFTSNNEEIVRVDELGLVTAVGAGTTLIDYETFVRKPVVSAEGDTLMKYMRVRAYCTVYVEDPDAAITFHLAGEQELTDGALLVYPNVTTQLYAYDADGIRLENVRWEQIDGERGWGYLTEDGLLTLYGSNGDKAERFYVRATAQIGGREVSALLTLNSANPPARIGFCYVEAERMHVGDVFPVTLSLFFPDPDTADAGAFTPVYTSFDEDVARITDEGKVEAVAPGIAGIRCELLTEDGAVCDVNYFNVIVDTDLPDLDDETTISFLQDVYYLALQNGPSDAYASVELNQPWLFDYYPIVYTSGNPQIVSIDESGHICHNEAAGTATIYARIGGHIGTDDPVAVAQVTVGQPEIAVTVCRADGTTQLMINGGEADLTEGDTIRIEVTGLPKGEPGFENIRIDANYNEYALHLDKCSEMGDSMTFTAIRPSDNAHLFVNVDMGTGWWQDFGFSLNVHEAEQEYRLNCGSFVVAGVGEVIGMQPEFGWQEMRDIVSDNTGVVRISQNGNTDAAMHVVGEGRATVTASCLLDDGETWVPVVCTVVAVADEWTLYGLGDMPRIMLVGERYEAEISMYNSGFFWPSVSVESSDSGILAVEEENGAFWLVPQAPGEVQLTITASKEGQQTQTVIETIRVVQPQLVVLPRHVYRRPGSSEIVRLSIEEGLPVQSVTWTSDNERIASVQPLQEDASGALITVSPDAVPGNRALITAQALLQDGSVLTASCWAEIITDDELWINVWFDQGDYREICMGDEQMLGVCVDSNAEISSQTFTSSDESVVAVSARGRITARKPGVATITYIAESYGVQSSARATVRVLGPEASLNKTELTLGIGESEYLLPTFEAGAQADADSIEYVSFNESVARVDHRGLVTAVGAGTTTVRLRMNVNDTPVLLTCTVTVTQEAPKLQIMLDGEPVTRATTQPRQELAFSVKASGVMTGAVEWHVSDPDWMEIDENGVLTFWGMETPADLSTAYISASAVVDGVTETAVCELICLPPQVTIGWSPNYYEVGAGEVCLFEYTVNTTDPSLTIIPEFVTDDPNVATIAAYPADDGSAGHVAAVITGVNPGVCMVHLNLRDTDGRLLTTGGTYVFVDTPLPAPVSEEVTLAFNCEAYYLPVPEDGNEIWCYAGIEGADWMMIFDHSLCYSSDNEDVVRVFEDGSMQAIGEGTTTIHAWFDGYEDGPRASATVAVGRGWLTVYVNGQKAVPAEDGVFDVKKGDTVVLELEDVPEGVERYWSNLDFDSNFFQMLPGTENHIVLAVTGDWESEARLRFAVAPNGFEFEDSARFRSAWQPSFDQIFVRANPGEQIELWPDFDWKDMKDVQSGDTGVALVTLGESGQVIFSAIGLGETDITASVLCDDGETWVNISCHVEVVEADWQLCCLDSIESVMQVGQLYEPWAHVRYTGFYGPEQRWEISDESVLHIVETDEGIRLEPLKPGQVTLTVTAVVGEDSQSLSKTITVTEPKLFFEQSYVELRPGAVKTVPLIVNVAKDDIAEITFSAMNDDMVSAVPVSLEDSLEPAARLTGLGGGGNTRVIARVSMLDGSVLAAVCEVHLVSNEEIWADAHGYDFELSTADWGSAPQTTAVWLTWDHNASHFDEPHNGAGTDTAWITWEIEDESIAQFTGEYAILEDGGHAPWNNGPIIAGLKEGETIIRAKLTLEDGEGNFLAESGAEFRVCVTTPSVELNAPNDGNPVEMLVGEQRYLGWDTRYENTREVMSDCQTVVDTSIAAYDMHGNVTALKPGETELQYTLILAGGKTFAGSLPITVVGPEIALAKKAYTVAVGETFDPGLTVAANGYELIEQHWENSNPEAVAILNDSAFYGAAPGQAQIMYYARLNDDTEVRRTAMVTVTGEPEGFALSESALTLFAEQAAQLTAEGVENAVWTSSDEQVATVDENGLVTAGRYQNIDTRHDATAIITCTGTKNGEAVSAGCHVTVRCPKVRIEEFQFGDGAWTSLNIGDEENIRERYGVCDSSVTVTRTITVDDPAIAEYDEEWDVLRAVGEGHTFAHYTVTTSEGETHTRDLFIRVNEDCWPDSLAPEYSLFIVPKQWNQHYLPLHTGPEYTGIYLECISANEDIVAFDEGEGSTEMYFHGGTGPVTVYVYCPEKPELSTQAKVLVIDEENLPFTLESESGENVLTPGQTVQLALHNSCGLDLSGAITVHYPTEYDTNRLRITQDGQLTVLQSWIDESCDLWAEIETESGWRMPVRYTYSVDAESDHLFLRQGSSTFFTLAPQSGTCLDIITNQTWEQEDIAISSSDDGIATVEWGTDEYAGRLLVIGRSAGKATITATLNGMTSSYPITVVIPTEIRMGVSNSLDRNVVFVGEEFEMYTWFEADWDDSFANFDRSHAYTSDNPDVLQRLDILEGSDPDGRHWMTLRALAPGQATITSYAWLENYPEITDVDTMTFTVLPAAE